LKVSGCARKETDRYCIGVEEEEECPSGEQVKDQYLPSRPECSGVVYKEVIEFVSHSERANNDWGWFEIGNEQPGDTCFYNARYRDKRDGLECSSGQDAAMDKIRHAQSAFAIANQLLGENLQLGEMSIENQLAHDLYSFASAVLEETGIYETLALLLASEQLVVVQDSMINVYLSEVAPEENNHSESAFATLRWCVVKGGQDIKNMISERFKTKIELSTENNPIDSIPVLGLSNRDELESIIKTGVDRVIRPSLHSLLEEDTQLT